MADQAEFVAVMAERVRNLAKSQNLNQKTLGDGIGIGKSAMSNYWPGKRAYPVEALPRLAIILNTNVDYLVRGVAATLAAVDSADADWVVIPEHDLRELTDESKGPVVSETPFRKDWLHLMLGQASGLWLTRLPADYSALNLWEGDLVFARDVGRGENTDRALYIVRVEGSLTVVRLNALAGTGYINDSSGEVVVPFRHFGIGEQFVPVARVMGMPLMRL